MEHNVTIFKAYPFKVGQKIRIEESRRSGDWEVVALSDHKITLKCPISKKEFSWNRFCYFTENKIQQWPMQDQD